MSGPREDPLPEAVLKPRRRVSLAWLLPILALFLAGWLGYRAYVQRGVDVDVLFRRGYGIQPGDEVRYHGIAIGDVRTVELVARDDSIRVALRLSTEAADFARGGTLFWVVRPQISLAGVRGLDTLLGSRYVGALPGKGAPQRRFVGLEEPLIVDNAQPGDLEILLECRERGNLSPGTPIIYREIRVGTVLSVGLAADARSVEARAHIERAFVPLIRQRTRFWHAGGVGASWGSKLLWMEVGGNLARVLMGGSVALATPVDAGAVVRTGHRFEVDLEPEGEWLEWQPAIAVGSAFLPLGAPVPSPLMARLAWTEKGFMGGDAALSGWLLQTDRGLLGPADLLRVPAGARDGSVTLEAAGAVVPLDRASVDVGRDLALLAAQVADPAWHLTDAPPPEGPLDCLAFCDRPETPLAVAAQRLEPIAGGFRLDPAVPVGARWHGACVLSRADGRLVGFLLVRDGKVTITLLQGGAATGDK